VSRYFSNEALRERNSMIPRGKISLAIAVVSALTLASSSSSTQAGKISDSTQAGTFVFLTPSGSTLSGLPVDAEADFTMGNGSITIVLKNLQGNPTSVIQDLSDLSFVVGHGSLAGSSESGATAQEITVNKNKTFSLGTNLTTPGAVGWVYSSSTTTGTLDVLGGGALGPKHLIIGPPGGTTYSNANGSIAGNKPHNPFLNQLATFVITAPNITESSTISSVNFSFGTTSGVDIGGVVSHPIPEPSSLMLSLIGIGLVTTLTFRRRRRTV
jgi:hypothetical protein